jgi:hypothetical protein
MVRVEKERKEEERRGKELLFIDSRYGKQTPDEANNNT